VRETEKRKPGLEAGFLAAPIPDKGKMGETKLKNLERADDSVVMSRAVEGEKKKEGNDSMGKIRPWTCAKVSLRVKPDEKGKRNRSRRLREDKEMMERGLMRSPYVKMNWVEPMSVEQPETAALVDTGADWSLIAESELTRMEKSELRAVDMVGQGVTKQALPIVGVVWRSVKIGDVEVPDQRFIVVSDMITEVILGADFGPFW